MIKLYPKTNPEGPYIINNISQMSEVIILNSDVDIIPDENGFILEDTSEQNVTDLSINYKKSFKKDGSNAIILTSDPDFTMVDATNLFPMILNEKEIDELLSSIKKDRIKESKSNLETFINEKKFLSKAHNPTGGLYTITKEKQTQMTTTYNSYRNEKKYNVGARLYWNEAGKEMEEYTETEFISLQSEIQNYVRGLVKKQQSMEIAINKAKTIDEVNNIDISFT